MGRADRAVPGEGGSLKLPLMKLRGSAQLPFDKLRAGFRFAQGDKQSLSYALAEVKLASA
jgi:hypothetical protein